MILAKIPSPQKILESSNLKIRQKNFSTKRAGKAYLAIWDHCRAIILTCLEGFTRMLFCVQPLSPNYMNIKVLVMRTDNAIVQSYLAREHLGGLDWLLILAKIFCPETLLPTFFLEKTSWSFFELESGQPVDACHPPWISVPIVCHVSWWTCKKKLKNGNS